MPTIYDYLPAGSRPPLDSLDERSRAFLSTEVPAGYPQSKLVRLVDMATQGLGRRARPAAPATAPSAPPLEMLPAHGPKRSRYAQLTETMPEGWRPRPGLTEQGYQRLPRYAQVAAQAAEAMGAEFSMPESGVPPPSGLTEHAARVAGSLAGFIPKTAALTPFIGPSAAVGGSMAASRGTPKERLVRGVTGAATAGVAGGVGKVLEPVLGPVGHVATTAVGFGAAQPAAESATMRLTGTPDYPAPTLSDLVRGTAEMAVIAGAPGAAGWAMGRGGSARASKAEVIGPERQLPPARAPKSRQIAAGPAAPGPAIEMPAGEGAPPAVFPVSRRLPGGPLRSSGEVFEMGTGKTVEQNRAPVVAKLAPEFANDGRLVAAGRSVGDVFREMVAAEAGTAPDRAAWKAAVRKVVASGRIQAVQDIAAALTEPGPQARRAAPELRAREARFTEELSARAAGRTVTLNLDGSPTQLRIARVVSFRYPGVDRPIRAIVEDPTNGRLFPLQFRSVAELAQAVNNPQAMVKVEDVFARSERQRAIRARGPAPGGVSAEATPAATAPGPAAPPAAAPARTAPREGPKLTGAERGMAVEVPKGPVKPVPAARTAEYVRRMGEGYAAMHGKLDTKMQGELVQRLETQARDKGADPADRRGAIEALRLIRGGAAGPVVEPGTGPKAPPAAPPAQPKRERAPIGIDFSDPKKAQAVAERLNRENPDYEAAVVMRRGKPVIEVNVDAVKEPAKPKAPERPKSEPAVAPAAPKAAPRPGDVAAAHASKVKELGEIAESMGLVDEIMAMHAEGKSDAEVGVAIRSRVPKSRSAEEVSAALREIFPESPKAAAPAAERIEGKVREVLDELQNGRNHGDDWIEGAARDVEADLRSGKFKPFGESPDERALDVRSEIERRAKADEAAEGAAEAGRPAGGASEPPAAPAAKKPREVGTVTMKIKEQMEAAPQGECFRNARTYAMKNDGTVVHGKLTVNGETFDHAWVEIGDDVVDPTPGVRVDKAEFYAATKAVADAKYSAVDAARLLARAKHNGPYTAEEVRAAGVEPIETAAPAADVVADEAAMEAASRFKKGERVSVPNEAIRSHDMRERVKGEIIGWENVKGETHVRVRVKRGGGKDGKFTWQEYTVREASVRKLADKAAAAVRGKAAAGRLADSMRERAAGSPAKARSIVRELEAKAAAFQARVPAVEIDPLTGRSIPQDKVKFNKAASSARAGWQRAMRAAEVAKGVHAELVAKGLAGREALHPDIEPFFSRSEDHHEWIGPLREAAEDFPEHFTHERQARHLRAAAAYEIPNAREWKATLEQERGMAERGVAPEHAAAAVDATARVRRMLEQDADNPLMDDAERAAARERWLAPERIDTPEALAATLKEFDAEHPQGPADDIPAGVQPVPPEGFAEDLSEKGMARVELLAPWLWLKALRDIPKNWLKEKRNIPKEQRQFTTYDGSGNIVDRGEHALYEPDYYSESAMSRLLAHFAVEPGAHVFTPEQRTDYKASISDQAHLETYWTWRRAQALGPDLAAKLRPYSRLSKQLDRVLEGIAQESTLPPDVRPAVQVMRDLYNNYWGLVQARYKALGLDPPKSGLEGRYVGPRLILGHISNTVERVFADFLKEGGPTPETTEMRNRFLHERTGDPVYREDSALRWDEYNKAMSKHLAFLGFFERIRTDIRSMEATDYKRAAAILNMLKSTLLRRKGSWERRMDSALAAIRFAKASPEIREVGMSTAAHHLETTVDLLKKGSGLERAFVVPEGATYRVGNDAKAFVLKRLPDGSTLVGTGGAHLFGEAPKLRPVEEGAARAAIRAKVAVKGAAEALNKKLTGEEGGYLSPHFSKDEHVRMQFEEWRDGVLKSQDNLTNSAFRAMGDRQTRAMLAGNWRAALANSMQPWLTLAPEIGYRRTLQAAIENALSEGRGKRMAEHTGSLQGELARTGELAERRSWFRNVVQALGGMAPYKYAEDFTRGVGMMGGSFMAKRLGYKPGVAQQMSAEMDPRFFDEWRRKIDAMRQSGTTENLQATIDTETMFDYNLLGQSPIFGGAMGKVLGRLMTFPGRYARRYVTRPLGGAAKVARALALGGVDRATGGALERAGMRTGPGPRFVDGRQVRGKYPGPANAFEEFLEHYGARYHDRQGAKVFVRQAQAMGAMAALTGVGVNAFLMGTPGWERLPLMALLAMTPPGSKAHERIKAALDATQRSAVIDPERGVESTMSPTLRVVKKAVFDDTTPAFREAMKKADEGKPGAAAWALSKPLTNALRELGLEFAVPGLIQVRRSFQQMPWAEQFFSTDAGKTFAHLMGIKSYIRGNGALGFIKGMTGLTPMAEEEKRRVRVDKPAPAVRRRGGRARSSIYGTLLGGGSREAFA